MLWLVVSEVYVFRHDNLSVLLIQLYSAAFSQAVIAVMLISTLIKFRRMIRKLRISDFFHTSKRMLCLHIGIFAIYLVAFLGLCVTGSLIMITSNDSNLLLNCRATIAYDICYAFCQATSLLMIVLLTIISVKFSEPISDYR